MWETIILTTFLLLMFLGLRYIVDGKISARFQYALWLIVAVRLLFAWVPMPDSRISISALVRTQGVEDWQEKDSEVQQTVPVQEGGVAQPVSAGQEKTANNLADFHSSEKKEYDEIDDTTPVKRHFNSIKTFWVIYIPGVCVMFCVILLRNLIFYLRLRKFRIRYEGELPVAHIPGKVYLLEQAYSPFLFGRNIYIAPEMLQNMKSLQYCLAHETCHYRQGDLFWSVIRNLCLVMYWYHPLVWLCVRLSDNDAELACDERVIALLGEEHRLDYGETLLTVIKNQARGRTYTNLSTQMSGSKRNVEKRIKRIAEKKTKWFSAAVFVVIGLAIAVLSTLPGTASGNDVSDRDTAVASDGMAVDSSSDWSVTETEGFPAMVVDEKGDIVDFVRGNLITKLYLDYAAENIEHTDYYPYRIKEHAFSNCVNLKTLIISNQSNTRFYIKEIADNAFDGCPKDMVVYCEENSDVWDYFKKAGFSVKAFDDRGDVFWGTLGENPEELEKLADKLTSHYDPDEEPVLTKEEMRQVYGEPYFVMTQSGRLMTVANSHSLSAYAESEVLFPKEATVIEGTFCNDTTLTKTITIPKHIKEIGDISFQDCHIRQLDFEEGSTLERIGNNAFMWSKFSEVQLPEGLKSIGGNAFVFCMELKEITIPASVETIGMGCFSLCDLEAVTILNPKVEFQGDPELLNEQVFDSFMYDEKKKEMVPNTKLTIICHKGSTAEVYAKQLGLKVKYI